MDEEYQGRFRKAAAGLIKSLVRARVSEEPNFLTRDKRRRWEDEDVIKDTRPCHQHLTAVRQLLKKFSREYLTGYDSIPSPSSAPDADNFDSLVHEVATFIVGDLSEAIRNAGEGKKVLWAKLARWEKLDELRDALDQLPSGNAESVPSSRLGEEARDDLEGPVAPDGFAFNNDTHHGLTPKAFRLIEALWNSKRGTISFDNLGLLIWDDDETDVAEKVGSLRHTANRFFEESELPFKVKTKGGYAILIKGP